MHGLSHAVAPNRVNMTDVSVTFDMVYSALKSNRIQRSYCGKLKSEIFHLAKNYVSSYKASKATILKHNVLKVQLRCQKSQ